MCKYFYLEIEVWYFLPRDTQAGSGTTFRIDTTIICKYVYLVLCFYWNMWKNGERGNNNVQGARRWRLTEEEDDDDWKACEKGRYSRAQFSTYTYYTRDYSVTAGWQFRGN